MLTTRLSEPRRGWAAVAAWLGAAAVTALLTAYYIALTPGRHLDSVFLFEAVESVLRTGVPVSPTVESWPAVTQLMDLSPERFCSADLPFVHGAGYNVLHNHAYYVLYPIAALAALVGAEPAFAVLNAIAHMALVVLPVCVLRRRGMRWPGCIAFAVLIACWPAWSQSAVGDYYLDRLYMPFMLALLFALERLVRVTAAGEPARRTLLLVGTLAVLTACFTERAAIMVAGALLYTAVVQGAVRRRKPVLAALEIIGSALVLGAAIYFKFIRRGFEGGGSLVENLNIADLVFRQPGFPSFVVVTLALLGGLGFLAGWRVWLLMLGAMLPNLLITTGGAELNGWSTHYHAMYIPFVIFAATAGWSRLVLSASSRSPLSVASLVVVLPVLAVAAAAMLDPYTLKRDDGAQSRGIVTSLARFAWFGRETPSLAEVHYLRQLADAVPAGARVSAVERAMPTLRRGHKLMLFPAGAAGADYLVVDGVLDSGEPKILQIPTFHPESRAALDACMTQRVRREGFRVVREVAAVSLLVLQRAKP
jgi:hypothetical protein